MGNAALTPHIDTARSRLGLLADISKPGGRALIASHNNPDPDAIAAALLLKALLREAFDMRSTLVYSGVVGRAENSALLEYAGARFRPLADVDSSEFDVVGLVDAQPGTGNHPFDDPQHVDIVFDHHRLHEPTRAVPFFDVRTQMGATTTLLYTYCRAAGIELSKKECTAAVYALRSETSDMGREAYAVDRNVYKEAYESADLRALSSIVHAHVDKSYFQTLHTAIERGRIYGAAMVVDLGEIPYPDVVAEIADYFLKLKDVAYTLVQGRYNDQLLLSLRSEDPETHLGRVARGIVEGLGSAGGHGSSAGGQIDVAGVSEAKFSSMKKKVVTRFLEAVEMKGTRPKRLLGS